MLLKCHRCSRPNPPEALFCYFDGAALGDPSRRRDIIDPARKRFPGPFVFPGGQACHTFDELTLAIQANWESAGELMRDGMFTGFFTGIGRADLAGIAREASRQPDLDQGIDTILRSLPSGVFQPPLLRIEPSNFNLGRVKLGQDLHFDLHLSNHGMGLLTGVMICEGGSWLTFGDSTTRSRKKLFQILHELVVPVHIQGKLLAASHKPTTGKILIDWVGGQLVVPVTLEIPVLTYSQGVLAGAVTPRQIAQKAREHPNEAAEHFADGSVARWYQSNGWIYPVKESAASGLAAVQQFFEALGLTTPPRVSVTKSGINLTGAVGESVEDTLQVVAKEKKPVFAHASADEPWLQVSRVELEGRTATIHLHVPSIPNQVGETFHSTVTITANGNQRFRVPVSLKVTAPAKRMMVSAAASTMPAVVSVRDEPPPVRHTTVTEKLPVMDAVPAAPVVSAPIVQNSEILEAEPATLSLGRYAFASFPVLIILFGLMITFVRDLSQHFGKDRAGLSNEELARLPQDLFIRFHDEEQPVQLAVGGSVKPDPDRVMGPVQQAIWEPSMRFGLILQNTASLRSAKRLTFDARGETNNTVLRLDGDERIFGERPFRFLGGRNPEDRPGRWQERVGRPERPMKDGVRSIWVYDQENVWFTQTVGLIPGPQSGRLDTCLVQYTIENKDRLPHKVGLRFMLDTFIGDNDGVPFLIPGSDQLCNTQMIFPTPESIPEFIQARESEDLSKPGTIALLQLKLPGLEPPSRVTLGAWPNTLIGQGCRQEQTLWDVPVYPIKQLKEGDSAVVIYWEEKPLKPGEKRTLGFAYGLGNVSGSEAGGDLGLSVVGSFTPGGELTLAAEVRNPIQGQTLSLELPPGFRLLQGKPVESVPSIRAGAPSNISTVSWRIKAPSSEGKYTLRVSSSTGVSQSQGVHIQVRGIFGN